LDENAILVARVETSGDVTSTLVWWKEVHKLRTASGEQKRTLDQPVMREREERHRKEGWGFEMNLPSTIPCYLRAVLISHPEIAITLRDANGEHAPPILEAWTVEKRLQDRCVEQDS
jgi:hypothetical protein